MLIVELNKKQFDEYAINHKYRSFYQTSQYGTLMSRHGYTSKYLGYSDNENIVAAALILIKSELIGFNYAYSPRGFLIDFNDYSLVDSFSIDLKDYLNKLGIIYLVIDPHVTHLERDTLGKPIDSNQAGVNISESLKRIGYEHKGFNLYFENKKPRWNMVLKTEDTPEGIFNSFHKTTRTKIRNSLRKGVEIYKGNKDDLKIFYQMVRKKHPKKYEYYLDMYDIFGRFNMFDVYYARINTEIFLKNSKLLYEYEAGKNMKLSNSLQKLNKESKSRTKLLNQKMESDKLLNSYKNDIIYGTKLYRDSKYIIIASNAVVSYGNEVFFLIDGINFRFKSFNANHLLKWKIIEEYRKKGYTKFHFNGITGDFTRKNKYNGLYEFKKGFNTNVTEYIGEYVLVINKARYKIYDVFKPFRDLFNNKDNN